MEDGGSASVKKFDSVFLGTEERNASSITVFPNPATDHIVISIPREQVSSRIIILDPEGRELIHRTSDTPKTSIDISMLSRGVWFASVTSGGKTSVVKFIKL